MDWSHFAYELHFKHTEKNIGGTEVTGKQGRRRKQLPNDLTETNGYWLLKQDALNRTMCRTRFARGYGLSQGGMRNE